MILGRVIGTVWATRKDPGLETVKFQIVRHLDLNRKPLSGFDVAVDTVQAGLGDLVLISKGSAARQTKITHNRPVDAVIMAVVENFDVEPIEGIDASNAAREASMASEFEKVNEN